MNIQEIEERNYNPECEYSIARSVSRQRLEPDHTARINAAVAAGKFVVVGERSEYCGITDAALGCTSKFILLVADDRETAEKYLAEREPSLDGDYGEYILPTKPTLDDVCPPPDLNTDDVPF